jgi:hypothetical protein
VLVNVHLLLNLLYQSLFLLVVLPRSRRTRSTGSDTRLLRLRQSRAGPASRLGGADVACGVAAGSRREAGVDGVGLHGLALGVGVFADLLAARDGDCIGVNVVRSSLLDGLGRGDGATAAGERVGGLGGAGHAAADGLIWNVLVGVHGVGGSGVGGAGEDRA